MNAVNIHKPFALDASSLAIHTAMDMALESAFYLWISEPKSTKIGILRQSRPQSISYIVDGRQNEPKKERKKNSVCWGSDVRYDFFWDTVIIATVQCIV